MSNVVDADFEGFPPRARATRRGLDAAGLAVMDDLGHKRVTVAGLGRFGGGINVARWLVTQGARVLVTDKEPADKLAESVRQLDGLPVEFRLGEHRERDFTDADLVVPSPAVPPSSPFLIAA